jgi:hypothetical protein
MVISHTIFNWYNHGYQEMYFTAGQKRHIGGDGNQGLYFTVAQKQPKAIASLRYK